MTELQIVFSSILSFVFFALVFVTLKLRYSPLSPNDGSVLFLHAVYVLFFSTFVGAFLAGFDLISFSRIESIEPIVKMNVYIAVLYSFIIILITYIFYSILSEKLLFLRAGFFSKENVYFFYENNSARVDRFLLISVSILSFYTFIKYLLYFKSSPLYFLLSGDVIQAAYSRMEVQTGLVKLDLPYISKYIEISCYFTTILSFIIKVVSRRMLSALIFYLSITVSFFYLFFEVEKSPFIYLLLMIIMVKIFIEGVSYKTFIYLFLFLFFLILMYVFVMGGDSNSVTIFLRILDRVVIGQNQAMFYMFQFFEPDLTGVFTDFYFSSSLGLDEIKPDVRVLPYIYSDTSHLINSNTFFLGEAWSFLGVIGVIFSPFIVSFSILFYLLFFSYFINRVIVLWPLGFVFFTILPINQSLQFIMYQKFFLYFVFFGFIPILFLWYFSKFKVSFNTIK